MSDAEALDRVDAAVVDAKSVGMTEEEDLVRFAALSFVPQPFRNDPTYANRVGCILNNIAAEPSVRLDFVFRTLRLERFGAPPLPFSPYRR